jgi:hypothetical protein
MTTMPVCPAGKSMKLAIEVNWLSSPFAKNIPLSPSGKSSLQSCPSRPTEGRLAIVTDAGRDAVDADSAQRRSALEADGEVVWS